MQFEEVKATAWMTPEEIVSAFGTFEENGEWEAAGCCDDRGRDLVLARTSRAAATLEAKGHLYEDGAARVLEFSASHFVGF